VEIVLATNSFAGVGGSETYLLTVGEELQRLGHGVTIHSANGGDMSDFAARRGLTVAVGEDRLPAECDAILVQDSAMAYELAERWPATPQVFRACTAVYDFQFPPQLPGVVEAVVVVNDRVARHLAAMDGQYEVVRLRHPIDTRRFRPLAEIRDPPRRAVRLGNYLSGTRRRLITEAWGAAGVECVTVGAPASRSVEPEGAIAFADIVVGKARAALDGMACGRAVYVYDLGGGDGWVTPESYAAQEADDFGGQATDWMPSVERLTSDLDEYRPEMGLSNRDLILAHHTAGDHVRALLSLFRRLNPRARPVGAPLRELARLVRLQRTTELHPIATQRVLHEQAEATRALEARVAELEAENRRLEERERELEAHASSVDGRVAELEAENGRRARGIVELEAYARSVEAKSAELEGQLQQRRVRAGIALGRLADGLRPHREPR
jgi:hypothetical protein